jgi:hypothetical protein
MKGNINMTAPFQIFVGKAMGGLAGKKALFAGGSGAGAAFACIAVTTTPGFNYNAGSPLPRQP